MSDQFESRVGEAVEEGENVRERVREAVEEEAGRERGRGGSALAEISQRAMDAAVDAVDRAAPKDPESTLRQVVDGLGQGLQRSAQATRFAVEEAASEGRAYASDDLRGVADDFRTIGEMFVGTVDRAAGRAAERTGTEIKGLRDHAQRTYESIRPSLQQAIDAASRDPLGLAGESAAAAAKGAQEAAGSLFRAVGGLLQRAGDSLNPESAADKRGKAPDDPTR